jgi:uncharacterized membrane protein (DUF4010 family)
MTTPGIDAMSLGAAIGIGLLVGLERERKALRPEAPRQPAGLRTFTIVSLLGWVMQSVGGALLVGAAAIGITALLAVGYSRVSERDPGLTTEAALLLVLGLGALSTVSAPAAVAIGVVLASLLAFRDVLHDFARSRLTETEVRDGLIIAAAALVILPVVPDRFIGPYEALNLRTVWELCVLMMAIGALGHLAIRIAGPRLGLVVAGFVSGFASSTATVGSMGARARSQPELLRPAVAAATVSSATTMLFAGIVLAVIDTRVLQLLALPLAAGFVVALLAGIWFTRAEKTRVAPEAAQAERHIFDWKMAFGPALLISSVQFISAVLYAWLGDSGLLITVMASGLADAQASAAAPAVLVKAGKLGPEAALLPILAAISTNTLSKCVVAWVSGGRAYALRVIVGLALIMAALWVTTGLVVLA